MARHPNLDAIDGALEQAHSPQTRQFLEYFLDRHPLDRLPARDCFDPIELPRLLPNIVLVQVIRPEEAARPHRFLVKVAGDCILKSVERPMIGSHLDELITDEDQSVRFPIADREETVATRCLIFRHGKPRLKFRLDFARVEVCHFPLAADGTTVDHIISIITYEALDRNGFSGKQGAIRSR